MRDILLEENENKIYDIDFENGDFKITEGLDTNIINSLFVDKRAEESEVSEADLRRGWLGNELNDDNDYEVGSKLFLIYQARNIQETLNRAIDYTNDCLNWMITDNLVKTINVTGEMSGISTITLNIEFVRFDNSTFEKQFELWENTSIV